MNLESQHTNESETPTPMSSSNVNVPSDLNPSEPLSTDTMSLGRDAMKELLAEEQPGLNISDLAAGSTVPKSVQDLHMKERPVLKIYCHTCHQKLEVTYMEPFCHFDCPSCNEDLIVPQWFDSFLLEEKIGIGGMAEVYRALDLTLDREVAIKVLNPELHISLQSREMFLNEAKMSANINSPFVVPIYSCGMHGQSAYIVMQFMSGKSLERVINEQGDLIDIKDAIKWLKDVASGLNSAVISGVVHHDVKPGNIMLDSENRAKICDFGLSQAVGDTKQAASRGWVSPHYVSPEKLVTGVEDFKGDVYSLGTSFYHILTGDTPFHGDDIDEIMQSRLVHDAQPISKLRDGIPEPICDLIMAMISREPDLRPGYPQMIEHISTCMVDIINSDRGLIIKNKKKTKISRLNKSSKSSRPFEKNISQTQKKNSIMSLIKTISVIILISAAAFYTFESNYFADPMKPIETIKTLLGQGDSLAIDRLPEVTKAFSTGDVSKASSIAKRVINSGTVDLATTKQAMLQLVVSEYLKNSIDAQKLSARYLDDLELIGSDDGILYYALSYMSHEGISETQFKTKLSGSLQDKTLSASIILIKNLFMESNSNTIADKFREFESAITNVVPEFWGNVWSKRLSSWDEALTYGNLDGVESVFVGKSSVRPNVKETVVKKKRSKKRRTVVKKEPAETSVVETANVLSMTESEDVSDIYRGFSASKLKSSRRKFLKRPRPSTFIFSDGSINRYLANISSKHNDLEGKRVRLIKSLKSYLVNASKRTPITVSKIEFKKETMNVSDVEFTKNDISFVSGGENLKRSWSKLSFSQFTDFLEFYADEKRSMDISSNVMSEGALRKNIAMEYYKIAVLCDWYKDYKSAVKFAKMTLIVDPRFEVPVEKLFGN